MKAGEETVLKEELSNELSLSEKGLTSSADDPGAAERKADHIKLAFASQTGQLDERFYYEPLLAAHPGQAPKPQQFLGKTLNAPIWISSMTGGTEKAHQINHNLAMACRDFGIGMGLGSCRSIVDSDDRFDDFNVRPIMGPDALLFANLGVAQIEQALDNKTLPYVVEMVKRLEADGLIIHVNPLQEWLQPEGDQLKRAPLTTIERFLTEVPDMQVIVKEVGQGMGPESLRNLLQLPLAAVDFAAHGGTNFSKLELMRDEPAAQQAFGELAKVGHSAVQMTKMLKEIGAELGDRRKCDTTIISGGIKGFLDGYYLISQLDGPAVYGQGAAFLKRAQSSYEELSAYLSAQIRGLALAEAYLKAKPIDG